MLELVKYANHPRPMNYDSVLACKVCALSKIAYV